VQVSDTASLRAVKLVFVGDSITDFWLPGGDRGKQDPGLLVDGLHPSEAGYRVWRDRLVPALASARAAN
jgi:lysophospholipase L1-like esterase